jgi:hypothetical protein
MRTVYSPHDLPFTNVPFFSAEVIVDDERLTFFALGPWNEAATRYSIRYSAVVGGCAGAAADAGH